MDSVTIAELQAYLKTHWETAKAELLTGTSWDGLDISEWYQQRATVTSGFVEDFECACGNDGNGYALVFVNFEHLEFWNGPAM